MRARVRSHKGGDCGRQRRRLAKLVRSIRLNYGEVFLRSPCEHRDAIRLGRMGLACPVISKSSFCYDHPKEITLFASREEASKRYPSWTMLPRSRRGS